MKNPYETLDVEKDASESDIKTAYRKLARQFHPDVNKESTAEAKFKEITEAYEILSDPNKKANYDQFGSTSNGNLFGFQQDFINSFFGRRQPNNTIPDDYIELNLTFMEAVKGCTKTIEIPKKKTCEACSGKGATEFKTCDFCKGTGHRTIRQPPFSIQTPCTACSGQGKIPQGICGKCGGDKIIADGSESVSVDIKAGVDKGMKIRVPGRGSTVHGGKRNNLIIILNVEEHERFVRDGVDIYCEAAVSYTDLVFGNKMDIPTLDGKVSFVIPAGTQPDSKFRLKGQGIPDVEYHGTGDLIVVVALDIPNIDNLDSKYIKALNKLKSFEKN